MRKNIMLDLETLGTKVGCPIISIGAVFFDHTGVDEESSFYKVLSVREQLKNGRAIDPDTLKWWMNQEGAARKVFNEDNHPVRESLEEFRSWCKERAPGIFVWGKGAAFDPPIIESLFDEYKVGIPWHFRYVRCFRTFQELCCQGIEVPFEKVAHNAVDDAIYQAEIAVRGFQRLNARGYS